MKNIVKKLLTILFLGVQINAYSQDLESRINGEIIGRSSTAILLIPIIKDNKFEYTLKSKNIEAYWLIFKEEAESGGFLSREFFNDSTHINVKIYPDSIREKKQF